jgi:hypothetical protein
MQVRPEVNLIVGACTNEVNAMECPQRHLRSEQLLSEKPIPTRICHRVFVLDGHDPWTHS